MKRITSFLLTLILIFTFATPTQVFAKEKALPGTYYGKVTKVFDGNSFLLESLDGQDLTFKIAGIDTSVNPDAFELTKTILLGTNVKVELIPVSTANLTPYSYGIVYYNNVDLAKIYLQSGFCKVDSKTVSSSLAKTYTSYENTAKYYKEGIWK